MAVGIFTDGEWRWLCLSTASALFTACAIAMIVRAPGETMRLTMGRSMLAIAIGVFGSRAVVVHWGIEAFGNDAVMLMGASGLMTAIGFTLGYALLLLLNTKSGTIAKGVLPRVIDAIFGKDRQDPDGK